MVGSGAQQFAGLALDSFESVGDTGGTAGVRGQERRFGAGDQVEVPVSAGLGHDVDGDRQPRAAHGAGLHGDLRAEVGAAGIAHRGHSALERGFHMGHGVVELEGERVVEVRGRRRSGTGQVDVAVDDPGQDRPARAVDEFVVGVVRSLSSLRHRGDPSAVDDDIAGAGQESGAVEDRGVGKDCDHGRAPHR